MPAPTLAPWNTFSVRRLNHVEECAHQSDAGRVKGWRAYIRVRWRFRRFRAGPQSGSHRPVSSPCSPNPACRFPAPGSPVGSCASHTDGRGDSDMQGVGSPTSSAAAARLPLCIPSRVRRAIEPVHASTTSNLSGSTPSLMHVMLPESLPSTRGSGIATPRKPSSFRHPSTPEAPFLDRYYPASSVVRASPPPWRPGLPLTGFRLVRAHHRQGFPCCHVFPLPYMPTPLPRRKRSGAPVASLPSPSSAFPLTSEGRLPHYSFRGLLSVRSRSGLYGR